MCRRRWGGVIGVVCGWVWVYVSVCVCVCVCVSVCVCVCGGGGGGGGGVGVVPKLPSNTLFNERYAWFDNKLVNYVSTMEQEAFSRWKDCSHCVYASSKYVLRIGFTKIFTQNWHNINWTCFPSQFQPSAFTIADVIMAPFVIIVPNLMPKKTMLNILKF